MEAWHYLLLAGLGILAGILNVVAGGGSLITLPVMVFLGLDGPAANGTNRVAILAQNLTAIAGFRARGFSDAKLSLTLGLATLPGAVCGAYMGTLVRGDLFNRILGGVLIGVLLLMVVQGRGGKGKAKVPAWNEASGGGSKSRMILGHACMVGVGFYGGFIQAGVGFLLMAALHQVMGLDLVRVNMHKVFIVGVFTLASLIVFEVRGHVLWGPGLALAAGNSLGGWIGSQMSVLKGEAWIRRVLYGTLVLMALKLFWPG